MSSSACLCKPELISIEEIVSRVSIARTPEFLLWVFTTPPVGACRNHGTLYDLETTAEKFGFNHDWDSAQDRAYDVEAEDFDSPDENKEDQILTSPIGAKYWESDYEALKANGLSPRLARAKAAAKYLKQDKKPKQE